MTSTSSSWNAWSLSGTGAPAGTDVAAALWGQPRLVTVYRGVTLGILLSLLWKSSYYPLAWSMYNQLELIDGFFPVPLRSPGMLAAMLLTAGAMILAGWWTTSPRWLRGEACLLTLSLAGLCWHQGSYNDVTFLTGFWAAAWCTWLAFSLGRPPTEVLRRGQRLAVLIVSLMFLGGAVGKWTPGYWSGEVLYQIYFVDRDFWFFNLWRQQLEPEGLRQLATGYSRMVILVETLGAGLWLLPVRWAGAAGMLTLLGIILFSNFYLFSVMFSLLGLCLVAILPLPAGESPGR